MEGRRLAISAVGGWADRKQEQRKSVELGIMYSQKRASWDGRPAQRRSRRVRRSDVCKGSNGTVEEVIRAVICTCSTRLSQTSHLVARIPAVGTLIVNEQVMVAGRGEACRTRGVGWQRACPSRPIKVWRAKAIKEPST